MYIFSNPIGLLEVVNYQLFYWSTGFDSHMFDQGLEHVFKTILYIVICHLYVHILLSLV